VRKSFGVRRLFLQAPPNDPEAAAERILTRRWSAVAQQGTQRIAQPTCMQRK
jgi:hypothetical protein